ncbi:hypothetical protein CNMCM6457_002736 [Aspergillus fumigatiaffinis]|nr:hypothetical protein CNMCM6457_002736 [Aspergillus fumigatiaffinis]
MTKLLRWRSSQTTLIFMDMIQLPRSTFIHLSGNRINSLASTLASSTALPFATTRLTNPIASASRAPTPRPVRIRSNALYNALLAFDADPAQKICILTGADGTFCAGADLHTVAAAGTGTSPSTLSTQENLQPVPVSSGKDEHVPSLGPMGPTRLHISKTLIAAIAGHAVAGGLELALLADLRIIEEDAVLGVFCRRWGVPLIDGGTVRLQAVGAVDGDGCDAVFCRDEY